jgi:hypothetical protein
MASYEFMCAQFLGAFMPLDAKVRCIECVAVFLLDITKTDKQGQSVHGNYMHKQGILFRFLHKKQRTGTILSVRDGHGGGWSRKINAWHLYTLMVYL